MNSPANSQIEGGTKNRWLVRAVLALAAIELILFSQSGAHGIDEGFHLLAASLVGAGKVPYRDFFYQHPPLFPYLYAGWMQIADESWRSAHLLSAFLSFGTVWLVATYLVSRRAASPVTAAVFALLLLSLNPQFAWLGTVGHPYALCMFLSVLAFRLVIHGVEHAKMGVTVLAGLAAGGAVLSSFLVAPVLPIVSIWILFQTRAEHRSALLAWFLAGAAVWLVPLTWFFIQAPQPMLFELIEYHVYYRGPSYRVPPFGALISGLRQLVHWARSWEGLVGTLLAMAGTGFLMVRNTLENKHRGEFGLAAALAAGLALFISTPYPTFPYYFVVVTPFVCILAYHGVTALARCRWSFRPTAFVLLLGSALVAVTALRPAYRISESDWDLLFLWNDNDAIAAAINRVTPANAAVSAPEAVQFAARRLPHPGLENPYAAKLEVSPALIASLNVVPQSQIEERIRQGWFEAVWMDFDDPRIHSLALSQVYHGHTTLRSMDGYGYLFWKRAP